LNGRCGKYGQNYKNKYFKSSILKYGWENFEHNILFERLSIEKAKEIEIALIKKYKTTNREFGYNISQGGDTGSGLYGENHPLYGIHKLGKDAPNYGKKHSIESKLAMSEAHKKLIGELNPFYGKHHKEDTKNILRMAHLGKFTGSDNPHAKSIINLDTGEIFGTLIECAKKYNLHSSNIVKVCKGERKSTGGFRFSYRNDEVAI
jgi:group I intron endonuclease